MKNRLVINNILALFVPFCYFLCHLNFVPKLRYIISSSIINFENTPQAYPVVRRCEAQTGGFIIFRGCYAL